VNAGNHERSTFTLVTCAAVVAGIPAAGCLLLGVWGAWWGIWPDIDHPGAKITKILGIPYRVRVRDKTGALVYVKPTKAKLAAALRRPRRKGFWVRAAWLWRCADLTLRGNTALGVRYQWRSFPGWMIHLGICKLSAAIFDAYATELDRRDKTAVFGMRFRIHRGVTHSVWFALASGLVVWPLTTVCGALFVGILPTFSSSVHLTPIFGTEHLGFLLVVTTIVGTLGHILGDGCTDYAVAPLAPVVKIKGRRYYPMRLFPEPLCFKVGKWVEEGPVTWVCWGSAGASALFALGILAPLWHGLVGFWVALS
jgi:hypothetical protein